MRVVFTTFPALGHLHPLVPLARALRARGHVVKVAAAAEFGGAVQRFGLPFHPAGLGEAVVVDAMRRRSEAGEVFGPGERGLRMFAEEAAPAMTRDLLEQLAERPPDCIVHEEGEWAGPVVAAVLGVPSVAVGWGAPSWTSEELSLIEELVQPLWRRHAVRSASPAGLFDHFFVDTCPPALQASGAARPSSMRTFRYEPAEDEGTDTAEEDPGEPQVYVTLGTVPTFNRAPGLLATIVEALADEPLRLLVTVGPGNDPAALGGHPRVRAEQYVPQSRALAGSRLAITHGGAGSTLGALAAGLPVLVLPRGASSQRRMAEACVRAGAGIALDDGEISPGSVRDAVRSLLHESAARERAQAVRAEMAALPGAADAAELVERLAAR